MIDHKKPGTIHVVTMNDGPNTICPDWQMRMLEILDAVEADCGQGAALVLAGVDKFFCNGLNLEKLMKPDGESMQLFSDRMSPTPPWPYAAPSSYCSRGKISPPSGACCSMACGL